MADSGDEAYVIRRALAGAPDPRQSSCVLIGVSDYGKLRELPAVRENLAQLPEVLADPETWGIPPERLHTIAYPQSAPSGTRFPPIKLDAACNFQYQATGLKHRFTSSDPNSAICYNPTTHVTYSAGISNMTGYCATLTTMAGVTATAANPGL